MTATLPIVATNLRFAYNDTEDRLTVLATDALSQGVHAALTRRLTERLVNGLAQLLEQSSALAVKAPAEMRDDIILMEHQDALYGQGQAAADPGTGDALPDLPAPRLVTAIDVNVTPATFEVRVRDVQTPLIALSLGRLDVHRLVEALSQRAEAAGWHIPVSAAWLEPGQTQIVLN
ncbi:hypothetical protein FV218_15050 [Methylobacterium sp. WL69]|uniref:hypothetical protein n=1 Tax=Methylobacterium sp. WL69 TaxID=2603893 RepID=UPI0011C8DE6C|nr:hypothetical protein [Methylobacterium sp. WL69]TXM71532.1 hypothetical protein FV218_15050 [Methylobacterium sp. WL69]